MAKQTERKIVILVDDADLPNDFSVVIYVTNGELVVSINTKDGCVARMGFALWKGKLRIEMPKEPGS